MMMRVVLFTGTCMKTDVLSVEYTPAIYGGLAMNATLEDVISLLESVKQAGWSAGQIRKLLELSRQRGGQNLQRRLGEGTLADLLEVDGRLDRLKFRECLGLSGVPQPFYWKTIRLGIGAETGRNLCSTLKRKGFRVDKLAEELLGQKTFTIAERETDIDLFNVLVKDLGFEDGGCYSDVCACAGSYGFELCPAEAAFQLRSQYLDQVCGAFVTIGMEPICDSQGDRYFFRVWCDEDGQWLGCGDPNKRLGSLHRLVFVRS